MGYLYLHCLLFFVYKSGSSEEPDLEKGREVDETEVPLLSNREEMPPALDSWESCQVCRFLLLFSFFFFHKSNSSIFLIR